MILLDCIVAAVISVCIKNIIKLVNFCVTISKLKMEAITNFLVYYALSFQESLPTETQTKICAVYGEGAVTD